MTNDTQSQPKRRRGLKIALGSLGMLVLAVTIAAFFMVGRPIAAPDWLRDRIETRIAQSLPGLTVRFGQVSVLIQRSGLARVILWDVELSNARGGVIAQLSDIEAGLSPTALLRGQIALREAQVSGAFVTLTRDSAGRLGLALGDAWGAQAAPDLDQIITSIDTVLQDPRLSRLNLVDADALTIRYEDLRARRGWTVDGGRLRLTRTGDVLDLSGDLALLGGGDAVAALELNANRTIGASTMEFGMTLDGLAARDIATQSPALVWLSTLDAPISGSLRSSLRADGALGPLNAVLSIGPGALAPNPATRPIPFNAARTYFTYDPAEGSLLFDEISLRSPLGQITADGRAQLLGPRDGWPTGLWGQFALSGIEAAKGALLDRAVTLTGADTAFKLDFDPFHLTFGQIEITDPALPIRASGDVIATPEGWQLALDARAQAATPEQVLSYWPADFAPKGRQWVAEHVQAGRLSDVAFALRADPDAAPQTYLDAAFDDGQVLFNKRLPPIKDASGRLVIHAGRLGLRLTKGQIDPGQGGPIAMAGTTLTIPDLRQKPALGQIDLVAKGSGTAALAFVDNDAWRVLRKAGRDASLATGQVALTGSLRLPLRKGVKLPDVDMKLAATLRNVASDSLVPGRKLRADTLSLRLDNDAVQVTGPVTLDGIAAKGTWRQPLRGGGAGSVTADVTLTPDALAAFGVTLPPGMVRGSGRAALTLALRKGAAPAFTVQSDLAGIGLAIPELGWSLSPRAKGAFRVEGEATKPVTVSALSLDAAGLRANGAVSLKPGGGLDVLRLDRVRLDAWLDVSARLRGRGGSLPPALEVRGGRADMRFATFGSGRGGGGTAASGAPLNIALDQLRVTESIVLNRFAGEFDTRRGIEGSFNAQVGGVAPITGQVVAQNGGSAFRIEGRDAGDILKAAGILKKVQDGTFRLDLAPVRGQTGSYDGLMTIRQTRLQGGSAITGLLDAISIVGIMDQLNGPGIYFDEVEARFRLTPSRVILSQSSAVGPSMGISLDGYYDVASGDMDMQGVLSPIYLLNGIGRLIARKGEGLIGFNFNMRGQADNPRILVNPLSVFTPGMFRDIFRRPPPKLSQ